MDLSTQTSATVANCNNWKSTKQAENPSLPTTVRRTNALDCIDVFNYANMNPLRMMTPKASVGFIGGSVGTTYIWTGLFNSGYSTSHYYRN